MIAPEGLDVGVEALAPPRAWSSTPSWSSSRILTAERGGADLYVALTRATQRLHAGPLPDALAGLERPPPVPA